MLSTLGLAEHLARLDDLSGFPPEVQHLPRVGRGLEVDPRVIAALAPDLVLAPLNARGMEQLAAIVRRAEAVLEQAA
ncbi:MAG: hypothetical protein IT307_00630 [Chloroflexi bacterium]|nr:hypothetical protein [Chloroflexota bacterium]